MSDSIDNNFSFCPKCGGRKIEYVENKKWVCPDCGEEKDQFIEIEV